MPALLSYPQTTAQVHIICPQGSLNAVNAMEFQQELIAALQDPGNKALIVNLERVEYLDSAGLMALVSALRLAQKLGRCMSLCSVSPAIRIVFELTQLDRVFEISDDCTASR
jgi:anti-sigma B factor antagonist